MLTGQRRLEIGNLEWTEIFAAKRQIELPAARCKNKQPHTSARSRRPPWSFCAGIPAMIIAPAKVGTSSARSRLGTVPKQEKAG
jgi:hypothetical protein